MLSALKIYQQDQTSKLNRSSHHGAVETKPTRNHASLSGLRSCIAMSCDVGRKLGSDLMLLWVWWRPAAVAPIGSLAWEPPYGTFAALKTKQQTNKKEHSHGHPNHMTKENNTRDMMKFKYLNKKCCLYLQEISPMNVWVCVCVCIHITHTYICTYCSLYNIYLSFIESIKTDNYLGNTTSSIIILGNRWKNHMASPDLPNILILVLDY